MTVLVDGELVLYGFVGDNYWDEGFTASDVVSALAELGRSSDVVVRINSGGGHTDDGIAIYNALSAHPGQVDVIIDAMAASCGSLIAMAGDTITMMAGSEMMIHGPSGVAYGKAGEIENFADHVRNVERGMAEIYAERSGEDFEALLAEMAGEIWLSPDDAIVRGFATAKLEAKSSKITAFDFRQYANAPKKLVAMAKKEKWTFDPSAKKAATIAAKPIQKQEKSPMATDPTGAAPKAAPKPGEQMTATQMQERIKAITQDEAAVGRETLANHFAFETEMSAQDALAALSVAASSAGKGGDDDAPPDDPVAYQKGRTAASHLAQPGGGAPAKTKAKVDVGAIYASRRPQIGA